MRLPIFLVVFASVLPGQNVGRPDPAIQKMLGEISQDRIAATMQKLASFDTRGNFSDAEQQDRGIGAARRWIFDQFKSDGPRLDVSFDPHKVKKQGTRCRSRQGRRRVTWNDAARKTNHRRRALRLS
jgi:hypothetical protein